MFNMFAFEIYEAIYTGEDLKLHTVGVLCTAKRQIVTDISSRLRLTAQLKIYTGEDLKWDTPLRGVFQIVTDI
jgi:hypothetical protein